MKISRESLQDWILWGDGTAVVSDNIIGHSRWSVIHEVVFINPEDGKTYETTYSQGATEEQDEEPWQYHSEVECHEVKAVKKTVTVYVRV